MWEGNYQLYVNTLRPTCPYAGNKIVCGICGREIINFMLIRSGHLVHMQVIKMCAEYVGGELSTLC
jgi:hypothetical protein